MSKFSYHASHEQFTPSELLKYAKMAEEAGFNGIFSSDHIKPWSNRQGQSGFSWAWLGAAMKDSNLPFGVVCAPGYRYHPAIVAQAAATLAEMNPGRFWMALGSGLALNEKFTGEPWPGKSERNARLEECAEIIRRLWDGETVTHFGQVIAEEAKLYTLPPKPLQLIGAALTPETAKQLAQWADGLLTIYQPEEKLRQVVDAFRENGGEGKPMMLQVQLSYAEDGEEALQGAYEQWKTNIFGSAVLSQLTTPEQFEMAAQYVEPKDITDTIRISTEPEQHADWISESLAMGFSNLLLHNVNRDQERFIETFGEKVLPALLQNV